MKKFYDTFILVMIIVFVISSAITFISLLGFMFTVGVLAFKYNMWLGVFTFSATITGAIYFVSRFIPDEEEQE